MRGEVGTNPTEPHSANIPQMLEERAGAGGMDEIDAEGNQKQSADSYKGLVNQVVEVAPAGTN